MAKLSEEESDRPRTERAPRSHTSSHKSELKERVEAVVRLTGLFSLERWVYITTTGISLALIFISAAVIVINHTAEAIDLSTMFGSAGLITYSCGRVLVMWNRSMEAVFKIHLKDV